MGKEHTDQKLLVSGIKRLALALPLLVLTTYIFTFGFLNKETLPLYIFMILGIVFMAGTIYLLFNGIRKILDSIF